jgi:hypothetical protein
MSGKKQKKNFQTNPLFIKLKKDMDIKVHGILNIPFQSRKLFNNFFFE